MSADPAYDMQKAVMAALKGAAAVQALVAARIYDPVPDKAAFPYISYGSDQVLTDDVDCVTGYDVIVTLDIWSRASGQGEVKLITGAVRNTLQGAELTLDNHALVDIEHETTRYLEDPDGKTHHGQISFRAIVEAA